ncbi:amidohydrolase [Neolewinella antarctica]|uniref:Amidohydrolase n=1 Tax=Neolewinella antarctica TaxID=442734 RepID=A0ABX0XA34_9BACT|nr:amidohydrolase [Neolewinella antarctica]NJC25683.1 putative amidohydrolase [Neolewinella antarctica]
MQNLRATLLQTEITWEAPAENRTRYAARIKELTGQTDLIILPEMFTTGFTMNPGPHAEAMNGPSVNWMAEQARRTNAAITGSLVIEEGGKYYNRLIFMRPDGQFDVYDKRHPFSMSGEHEHYAAGTERVTIKFRGWRIRPLICYDLRFPVWSRNHDDYDLLIYVANWPDRRAHDWRILLQARAIENQAYVIGVNRVGADENGHAYNGDSCVISPGWDGVISSVAKEERTWTETLSADHLRKVRQKLPFLADRNDFSVL